MKYLIALFFVLVLPLSALANNIDKWGSFYFSETLWFTSCLIPSGGIIVSQTDVIWFCYSENGWYIHFDTGSFVVGTGTNGYYMSGLVFSENLWFTEFYADNLFYEPTKMWRKWVITGEGWNENTWFERMGSGTNYILASTIGKTLLWDWNFDFLTDSSDFTIVSNGLGTTHTFDNLIDVIFNQ